jgi:hypothetical protein
MDNYNSGVDLTADSLLKSIADAKKVLNSVSGNYTVYPYGESWIASNTLLTNPKSHDGAVLFSDTYRGFMPSVNSGGVFNTGLTDEQARAFEIIMNLKIGTMSPYNKEYWSDVKKNLIKITKEGLKLNCDTNYNDKLTFLILKAHSFQNGPVAMSTVEAELNPFTQFIVKSDEKEAKEEINLFTLKRKAFSRYEKSSLSESKDFLKIYKNGKYRVRDNTKNELIEATMSKIVDTDPKGFIELIDSQNFKDLVFVEKLIENGLLKVVGIKILTPEGDLIGQDKNDAVNNLRSSEFQDVKISLKSKLEEISKR